MKLQHVKSSFPIAVGADISAVDSDTFSATGKAYSFIALPNAESSTEKTLQEDDISLGASPPMPGSPSALATRLLTLLFPLQPMNSRRNFPAIPPSERLSVPGPLQFASLTFPARVRSNLSEKGVSNSDFNIAGSTPRTSPPP